MRAHFHFCRSAVYISSTRESVTSSARAPNRFSQNPLFDAAALFLYITALARGKSAGNENFLRLSFFRYLSLMPVVETYGFQNFWRKFRYVLYKWRVKKGGISKTNTHTRSNENSLIIIHKAKYTIIHIHRSDDCLYYSLERHWERRRRRRRSTVTHLQCGYSADSRR